MTAAVAWLAARRAHVLVALVAAGLALAGSLGATRPGIGDPHLHEGQRVTGRAYLREAPRPGRFGPLAETTIATGPARGAHLLARFPRGARLPAGAGPGLELALSGAYRRLDHSSAGFDYAAHLERHGVEGELAVEEARATGRRRGGALGTLDDIRSRAEAGIAAGMSQTTGAVARGMVLGADESISPAVRDDFRDAGLGHLLAASGQNVVLLVALAMPLLAAIGVPRAARTPSAIGLIALYVPLAGGGPSIQRAGIMGVAALAAVALSRPASRWYALGLAACVTLAIEPRMVGDAGWQLSFAAVAGILLLGPRIRRSLGALPAAAAEAVALTVAATVATAPLVAHHFGSIPLVGLPANVLALPLVAPIMWLGMLRAVAGQMLGTGGLVGPLARGANAVLGALLAPLVEGLEPLAALFADAPDGQLRLALATPFAVAVAYVAIAIAAVAVVRIGRRLDTRASTAAAYVRRLPRRRRTALVVAAASLATLLLARGLAPAGPPATLTVTFLDVGQGDATLIQHPDGTAVLFDGGPPEGGVTRLLRRAGVRRLSVVVMTHPSRDHHGGLADVVGRFPIGVLLDGGDGTRDPTFKAVAARAEQRGARRIAAHAPLTLRAGALRIDVLSPRPRPPGPPPDDPNPRAVVAIVSCDGFELLLSADAESEALLPLSLPDVDAMKLPHHGSSDPGLPEVLERLRPEVASIPVGAHNGYGHPAPSTLTALRAARIPTWRNDRNGSVRLTVDHGALSVRAEQGDAVAPGP